MRYDPATEPIDKIFLEVEKLAEFAEAADAAYTPAQIINLAYVIIKGLRVFGTNIMEWNRRVHANPAQNTWLNFKVHFRLAYKELKEVGALTAEETPFNQANFVQELVDAIREQAVISTTPTPALIPDPGATAPQVVTQQQVDAMNAVRGPRDPDISALLLQQMLHMQNFQTDMLRCLPALSNPNTRGGRGNGGRTNTGRGCGRSGRANTRTTRCTPREIQHCWTHGWGTHSGQNCNDPDEGHQVSATVQNRMGGSVCGLPPGYAE